MWKIGGAKAAAGASLEEVRAVAQKAIDNCRSIGVGLGPCTLPAVGHPNFRIEPGTMEVGIGHHGEPGVRVEALKTAEEVAVDMCKIVLDDHDLPEGTEVAVLVSGLGATPLNELYILNDTIEREISARSLKIYRTFVGNYFIRLKWSERRSRSWRSTTNSRRSSMSRSAAPPFSEEMDMQTFDNAKAGDIVLTLADRIIENRAYLSEIDGKIGDGDHGVNMAKGFGLAAERLKGKDASLAVALDTLGTVLMTEIGGSMGPLYGGCSPNSPKRSRAPMQSTPPPIAACFMRGSKASGRSAPPRWATRRCRHLGACGRRLRCGDCQRQALRRCARRTRIGGGGRPRFDARPGCEDRPGEPPRRTLARRVGRRRHLLRDHPQGVVARGSRPAHLKPQSRDCAQRG